MNIYTKILIGVIAIILVGGGVSLGVKKFVASHSTEPATTENQISTTTESTQTSASSPVPASQAAVFKTQALKIVARPIEVKANLSATAKEQAISKINENITAIKQNYDFDKSWLELGSYRQLIGDYEGAVEAWNFLTIIRPKDFVAFHNLGSLYGFELHNYPKAEENFLKAISNNPQDVDAYSQMVTIYQTYQPSQIDPFLLQGTKASPNDAGLFILLGQYSESVGNKPKALAQYEQALKIQPSNTSLQEDVNRLKTQ